MATRRKWLADEKTRILRELDQTPGEISKVASRNGVALSTLYNWCKRRRLEQPPAPADTKVIQLSPARFAETRDRELDLLQFIEEITPLVDKYLPGGKDPAISIVLCDGSRGLLKKQHVLCKLENLVLVTTSVLRLLRTKSQSPA